MKWPNHLVLVRHGESEFNRMKFERKKHPLWSTFINEFNLNHRSEKTKELAQKLMQLFKLPYSDYHTPLTDYGRIQARETGVFLKNRIPLPDVVITSPFIRCRETFNEMKHAWPELERVPFYTDELIQEKDIGMAIMYNDRRIFQTFHPEQKEIYDLLKYYHYREPQGENMVDIRRRARMWFGTLIREFSGKCVLSVMHHVSIIAVRANLERMSPEDFMELDRKNPPKNCSVTIYKGRPELGKKGKLAMETYNEIAWKNQSAREEK